MHAFAKEQYRYVNKRMTSNTHISQETEILLNSLNSPAFVFNRQFMICSGNKQFSSLFRLSREASRNRPFYEIIRPGPDQGQLVEKLDHLADTETGIITIAGTVISESRSLSGKQLTMAIQAFGKNKQAFLAIITAAKGPSGENRPDVSDEQLFKLLLNELPDAIYFKDLMGRFFLTNRLHIKKLGLKSVDDFTGKTDFDLFSEEHARQAFDDEQYVIRNGATISKEEKETHLNGSETWASTSKMPLKNEKGKVVGTFGISKDITQIKNAEIQLRKAEKILQEANESKDKFFSILAHDLINPFNSLIGLSEWLVDEFNELTDDEKLDMVRKIHRTSESAYALLENLLDWARMQKGSIRMNPEILRVDHIISEVTDINHLHAFNKKIEIKTDIEGDIKLLIDPNMFRTIVRNLVSNAIKFTQPEGAVLIKAIEENHRVIISVKDNGIGMDKETLERLFKISEKVKTYGTADESGTGLGLIIVREFVEKNHGTLSVESTEGKGSTFSICFPALKA